LTWIIKFEESAKKELAKLDKPVARRIIKFLRKRVSGFDNPRTIGEALKGSRLGEFWRYRVGDYRIICNIDDKAIRILVLRIGHRSEVYVK